MRAKYSIKYVGTYPFFSTGNFYLNIPIGLKYRVSIYVMAPKLLCGKLNL